MSKLKPSIYRIIILVVLISSVLNIDCATNTDCRRNYDCIENTCKHKKFFPITLVQIFQAIFLMLFSSSFVFAFKSNFFTLLGSCIIFPKTLMSSYILGLLLGLYLIILLRIFSSYEYSDSRGM